MYWIAVPYMRLSCLQEYEVKDNRSTVAVSAGDKAFIFWRVSIYVNCCRIRS